jgi:hypothetical protein
VGAITPKPIVYTFNEKIFNNSDHKSRIMNLVKREVAYYHQPPSPGARSSPSPPPPPSPHAEDLTRLRQLAEIAASRGHLLSSLLYPSPFIAGGCSSGGDGGLPAALSPASSFSSHLSSTPSPPPPQESPIDLRVLKCRRLDCWAQERRDSVESNR